MDCQHCQRLLGGYLDGELDLLTNVQVEEHLQSCASCSAAHRAQQALHTAIRSQPLSYSAPAGLRRRIQQETGQVQPTQLRNRWVRPALSLAAAAALLLAVTFTLQQSWRFDSTAPIVDELVASHVRSLQVDHAADVASNDSHQVKPWFNGKLDYSPAVTDLAEQGFPLVGGRLDYVDHRPVAALVYERRRHVINLYCWPTIEGHDAPPRQFAQQGFHLVHWTHAGLTFWAISDLNAAELSEFAKLLQAAGTPDRAP